MPHTVSTLLMRNLNDMFGEADPVRRRAAIDEIFHEDAVFYDPNGDIYRGRDEIDRIAGVIKASHPDFRYRPLSPPEEKGNGGGSVGSRVVLASRRLWPELILSSPGTARFPPSISFLTRFPELDTAAGESQTRWAGHGR
jgi:hypothetical protein